MARRPIFCPRIQKGTNDIARRRLATSWAFVTVILSTCRSVNKTPGRIEVTALSVNQAPLITKNTCERRRKLLPLRRSFSGDFVFSALAHTVDSGTLLMQYRKTPPAKSAPRKNGTRHPHCTYGELRDPACGEHSQQPRRVIHFFNGLPGLRSTPVTRLTCVMESNGK